MLKKKNIIILLVVIILAVGGVFCYLYIYNLNQEREANRKQIEFLAEQFSVSKDYVKEKKEKLKKWDIVEAVLLGEKMSFKQEKVTELSVEGYLAEDMERAQQFSVDSGVDKLKILKERGKPPKLKSWEKVIKNLKLDLRDEAEKLGLSKDEINEFKDKGYSKQEILDIASFVENYKMTVAEIKSELENGKTVNEINEEQFNEKLKKFSENGENE